MQRKPDVLEQRFKRLDRWLRFAVGGWLIGITVVGILLIKYQPAMTEAKPLKVRRLVITDEEGRERIRLGELPDGTPGIALFDDIGKLRVGLGALPAGLTALSLHDRKGEARVWLLVLPDDKVILRFNDVKGKGRIVFRLLSDGKPELRLYDEKGRVLFKAP